MDKPKIEEKIFQDYDKTDLDRLALIVANVYREKKRKRPVMKKITEKVVVEESVKVLEKVDIGPANSSIYLITAGSILSLILFFTVDIIVGIIVMLISIGSGTLIGKKFRSYEMKNVVKTRPVEKEITKEIETGEYIEEVVPREYKVVNFGKITIPFEAISLDDDHTILVGPEHLSEKRTYQFPILDEKEELEDIIESMNNNLNNVPYILSQGKKEFEINNTDDQISESVELYGYENELVNHFLDMNDIVEKKSDVPISIQFIKDQNISEFLKPVSDSVEYVNPELLNIKEYIDPSQMEIEKQLTEWKSKWGKNTRVINSVRYISLVNEVSPISLDLTNIQNYSGFNFYCPECNKAKSVELLKKDYLLESETDIKPFVFLKNSKCIYIPEKQTWQCPICSTITDNPIPMHKMMDEIMLPVYDKLMEENKKERDKTHNDIQNKEINILNEMEKELESGLNLQVSSVYSLTDEIERIQAEIEGETEAIKSIQEISKLYSDEQSRVMHKIEENGQHVKNEISRIALEAVTEVENIRKAEMGKLNQELTYLSKIKRVEDEKRDSVQREILQAAHQQTDVLIQGFTQLDSSIREQGDKIVHGLDKVGAGISEINKNIKKGNAVNIARAKKEGINVRDYNPLLNPMRFFSDKGKDFSRMFTGKSTYEIEGEKLNSDK